ncbi:energy transducer TonB [Pseudoalteromonas sp. C2R02]|uniref:energy transducer TonB n=1 Tax=Pseudoalteromonas sp. C2R02 TaxID=2841565 RepID=UPI001C086A9B|nr:energy transducer TonB [Pseudoalteromonas sp. C2R02]MBU2969640.1 energy transducer TonB [Pseudoalteromonas sp. C2R02]
MTIAITQSPLYKSFKFSSFILGASITTIITFAFMHYLIKSDYKIAVDAPEIIEIDVMQAPLIKAVKLITRVPPPPQVKPQPPKHMPPQVETVDPGNPLTHFAPVIKMISSTIKMPTMTSSQGEATPLVRITPKYPITAARDGKEGWVQLGFTISEIGTVISPYIINSEPKRVFDKEAIRALRKWKYKPKMVEGNAVAQTGQSIQLDFKLDKSL